MPESIALPGASPVEASATKPSFLHKLWVKIVITLILVIVASTSLLKVANMARVPELVPLARVATLPESEKLHEDHIDQRLILVGDVHGMYDELQELLDKVNYKPKKDTLVFLGDMITKGYDSLGVVDFAIKHNAYCVRGNHEDEILSLYAEHHHLNMPMTFPPHASASTMTAFARPKATLEATYGPDLRKGSMPTAAPESPVLEVEKREVRDEPEFTIAKDEVRDGPLVKALKPHHIEYLAACPAILELGQVSKRGIEAVAVHGGLLWHEHELEKQDIVDVLRIRSIVPPDFTQGSEDPDDGEPWFPRWNEEQRQRPKNERYEVFYGHDASKGLQLERYSKGLDTKCQRGGKLSAYVVRVKHNGRYREDLVQIKC